ncbi:hypothetical protein RclHR1_11660002 [Rhizophagus clarus]|uniref:S-adenosyl-L-methionine-dependent methyltransferase n=1 Tax=Rhizophagus clarus TaxID=94130 RepID=A0A2Z6Q9A2_9GLOM|nr:hypothetical protein RclHR1_11660002 [Rhizophagus clarus]GES97743.1 S-adenosyl-L-methionine-dependent methyltransferase [Rhizophagus clarus]
MGNITSHAKYKRLSSIKKLPEFDHIESEQERQEKLMDYFFSNDNNSIDRFHMLHFLRAYIFQSNFSSPIEDKLIEGGCKVINIGCGPGTWLLDLSNKYRNSYFFGIDVEPIFPKEIKPNNLEFIEADIINGLSFRDNEFDFTHIDLFRVIYSTDQWDFILSELIRVTKPGGYIEVTSRRKEHITEGPIFSKLANAVWTACQKLNLDIELVDNLFSKFESQPNMGNVHLIEKNMIIGPRGGKIGLIAQELALSYLNADPLTKFASEELGISEEEYKNMVEKDLVEELKEKNTEYTHVRFWSQKQLSLNNDS